MLSYADHLTTCGFTVLLHSSYHRPVPYSRVSVVSATSASLRTHSSLYLLEYGRLVTGTDWSEAATHLSLASESSILKCLVLWVAGMMSGKPV